MNNPTPAACGLSYKLRHPTFSKGSHVAANDFTSELVESLMHLIQNLKCAANT